MRAEPRESDIADHESSATATAGRSAATGRETDPTDRASGRATREREEFLTGGMVPLACASCGTRVLVKKNSPEHTSIQWLADAGTSCPVFATEVAKGTHPALLDACGRLQETIADAARKGTFEQ